MKTCLLLSLLPLLALTACATDVKGENCGFLDAYVDDEGNTYCPDENAPADCEELKQVLVASFVDCGLDEETAQGTVDDSFPCDSAVATTTAFDVCVDTLEEGCSTVPPEECVGAVLTN